MKLTKPKKITLFIVIVVLFLASTGGYVLWQRLQTDTKVVRVAITHRGCDEMHTDIDKVGNLYTADITTIPTSDVCTKSLVITPVDVTFHVDSVLAQYQIAQNGKVIKSGEF